MNREDGPYANGGPAQNKKPASRSHGRRADGDPGATPSGWIRFASVSTITGVTAPEPSLGAEPLGLAYLKAFQFFIDATPM